MPPEFESSESLLLFRLVGDTEGAPSLLDVSSFLYDFNLLYEVTRLATDRNYHAFSFTDFVLYRNGRPLTGSDRLHVLALKQESPLLLVAALAGLPTAIGAVWGVVQIVEKIASASLERRKLKAEIEKLERENQDAARSPLEVDFENPEDFKTVLRIREAETYYDNIGDRLERSSVRIKEFTVEVVRQDQLRRRESGR